MAQANADNSPPAAPSKSKKAIPAVVVALLMAVEGAGVFFVIKWISPTPVPTGADAHMTEPAPSEHGDAAANDHGEHPGDGTMEGAKKANEQAELALVDLRTINNESGKLIVIQMRMSVVVPASELEKVQKLAESKKGRIEDKVNFVLRSADMKHLKERGLETIKRRLKHELDIIFEDDHLIGEVLIPQMLQSGSGL